MHHTLANALVIGLILLATGCGTIFRGQEQGVYRGVQWDVHFINQGLEPAVDDEWEKPSASLAKEAGQAGRIVWGVIDMPFSAIFDTLLLPYDLIVAK